MQAEVSVALKEMSRISTLCLRVAIAILVQQKIFECSEQCNCKCGFRKDICDEIKTLKTNDIVNEAQWRNWNTNLMQLKMFSEEFNPEVWIEKLNSFENKIKTIDDLEERLSEAESRAESLKNAEEDTRNQLEVWIEKVNLLEERLSEAESRAERLKNAEEDTRNQLEVWIEKVNSLENKIKSIEGLEGRLIQTESPDESLKTARENTRNHLEINISKIEERMHFVENQTKRFELDIEAEKIAREQLKNEVFSFTSKRFSEVDKQHEELRNDFETRLLDVKIHTMLLISDMVEEKSVTNRSDINISSIDEKVRDVENETNSFQPIIKEEKRDREMMKEELLLHISKNVSEVNKQNEQLKNDIEALMLHVELNMIHFKSDIEKIKIAWKTSEENVKQLSDTDTALQNSVTDMKRKLSRLERDTRNLQRDLRTEKQAKLEIKEELLLNTSKKFSDIDRWNEQLKKDIENWMINMEIQINLSKSDVEKIKIALDTSETHVELLSKMMSELRMNDMEFLGVISEVEKRLSDVKRETEAFTLALKEDKGAMEKLGIDEEI